MSLLLLPRRGGRDLARAESGFTILELVSVMALLSVVLTLGAAGFRHYWLLHSLESAQGDVASQLRQVQARVASESHPFIYGARFTPGGSTWSLVKYDQGADRVGTSDDSCGGDGGGTRTLPGVEVVGGSSSGFSAAAGVDLSKCGGAYATDVFVMFYARGTATGGKLTLRSPALDRTREIHVSSLTSRVEER
ncbi:MAG TPA: prepilin-type N-terminal cleavage/methylation domain-containing protein [Actinomycetota bacterium]|nr:prepilin-type N-terminal cleavage/methylation domain-containing protein [Actinomycetota bacterium]